jgi:hypothetical protein
MLSIIFSRLNFVTRCFLHSYRRDFMMQLTASRWHSILRSPFLFTQHLWVSQIQSRGVKRIDSSMNINTWNFQKQWRRLAHWCTKNEIWNVIFTPLISFEVLNIKLKLHFGRNWKLMVSLSSWHHWERVPFLTEIFRHA